VSYWFRIPLTADAVETEVPPLGAVLPVIVIAPLVLSSTRLLPAT
jgi:hypothetical protein